MAKTLFMFMALVLGMSSVSACYAPEEELGGSEEASALSTRVAEFDDGHAVMCNGYALEDCFKGETQRIKGLAQSGEVAKDQLQVKFYGAAVRCRVSHCRELGQTQDQHKHRCHEPTLTGCGQLGGGGACVSNACPQYNLAWKKKKDNEQYARMKADMEESERQAEIQAKEDRKVQEFIDEVTQMEDSLGGSMVWCGPTELKNCIRNVKQAVDLAGRERAAKGCFKSACGDEFKNRDNLCPSYNMYQCLTVRNGGFACGDMCEPYEPFP